MSQPENTFKRKKKMMSRKNNELKEKSHFLKRKEINKNNLNGGWEDGVLSKYQTKWSSKNPIPVEYGGWM